MEEGGKDKWRDLKNTDIYIYIYSMFIWKIFFINFQIFMSRYLMLKIMDFFK